MNKGSANTGVISARLILAAAFMLILSVSCLKQPEKTKFRNLIPEKDFVSILNDIHLANGLMAVPEMRLRFVTQDSTGLYDLIVEGYGYSKGQMDTTIRYYYIKKPKKLISFYDQMLATYSELEAVTNQKYANTSGNVPDQWKGNYSYLLPDTRGSDKPDFELILSTPGTFSLTFSVTVFPDDQTVDPRFSAWLCNADSLATGRKTHIRSLSYLKDGQKHSYTFSGTHTERHAVILKGSFFDYASNPGAGLPNAAIGNIVFYYSGVVL